MSSSHAVSGEYLHPVGTEAGPSLRRCNPSNRGKDDRRVSLIVAPWVDTSSFDRQLLPTQWQPGSIVRAKLYMHANYATHPVENTRYRARTIRAI